mmetsp:Transcript_13238/g.29162  ORF Transcript_13238/g.29162 Transcript_13238/m.29162 type:complete len:276 (-) Transcript_13238:27-854(-)
MTTSDTRSTLKLTRMCKYWASNRCTMGDACNFAHSDQELREQPDLVATKLCFQFMSKGRCNKGSQCTFAHGKKELRQLPGENERKTSRLAKFEPMKINTQMAREANAATLAASASPSVPMAASSLSAPLSPLSPAGPGSASQMRAVQSKLEQLVLSSSGNSLALPFRPPPGLAPPPSPASICSPCSPLSPKSAGRTMSRRSPWASPVMEEDDVDAIVNFSYPMDNSGYPMDNSVPALLKMKDLDAPSLASTSFPLGSLEVCDSEPVSPKSEIVWL